MAKPYDSVTKQLIEEYPQDWLNPIEFPFGDVEALDADLSTIVAEADKLIKVNSAQPYIAHIEMQASYKPDMANRFLMYNAVVDYKTGLPVRTAVILLRPEADGRVMREPLRKQFEGEMPYYTFHFRVVRLWEMPVETFLEGGLGVLPFAPLCRVSQNDLPNVIRRMEERIKAESSDRAKMLAATYILMGVRYDQALTDSLFRGVMDMEESVTYQAILQKGEARGEVRGEARGERKALLLVGKKRLGQPSAATIAKIESVSSPERLEALLLRVEEVESWSELLANDNP